MGAHRTARRITAACDECGRTTGDRSVTTEDGYTFQRQPDGSWTDGDMTFGSLDEIESQVGIKSLGPGESEYGDQDGRSLCLDCWQEDNAVCAGCDEPFPHSELSPDPTDELRCDKCLADLDLPFSRRPDPQASSAAARAINGIGAGLRAAIEREAMWQSTLHENYDDDFGQWLAYSDMYGLAARLGYATAEEAWRANPTVQGSTDPTDFKVVPDGEQMDMELSAALRWTCESCGSDTETGEPCDCVRRPEARQPELARAVRAARESLDMGDLVIKESPPSMGGMDIYGKGPGYAEDQGDLEKVTFLNERGMEELGEWITSASAAARRIASTNEYFVGEVFMPGMRTDPRHEGRMGHIAIGGDRGDVRASGAHADERDGVAGVTLTDVEFRTSLDLGDLDPEDLMDEVLQVVGESYESIQEDTFAPTRTAVLAPDDTGRLVRRPPAKPMSVDRDVDTEGMEPETCPRCKGHGGVFPADEGEDCNLCDGNGEVFRHPDGSYSNETDRNTYLY